jgi:hypothetical protein
MFPVVFPVPVIIDDIDAAGDTAPCQKSIGKIDKLWEIKEFAAKKQGEEQKQIFCPIFGS